MKIACVQMDISLGNVEVNFHNAREGLRRAAEQGADTVLLPEMWNSGFLPPGGLGGLTDWDGRRVEETLGALCAEYQVNLVAGSVTNVRRGKTYNTCLVFDRQGRRVAEYDKMHLFLPGGEGNYFTAGDHVGSFTLDGVSCGVVVCYDLRFPEQPRELAMKGAQILFIPAEWPASRYLHWQVLTRARAIENQIFVVGCNCVGLLGGGHSLAWKPSGEPLGEAGDGEEILMVDCDLTLTGRVWDERNAPRAARPEMYRGY